MENEKTFYIRKNNVARCYVTEKAGQIKNTYNDGLMNHSAGDWICYDPKDITDSWVIVKNLHQNYTVLTEQQMIKEAGLRKNLK